MKNKNAIKRFFAVFTCFLLSGLTGTLIAQTYEVAEAEIVFSSRTQIERFDGISYTASGFLETETGRFRFEVPVDSIRTGNSRRDAKMRSDYLLSHNFPYIKFDGIINDWSGLQQMQGLQSAKGTFSIGGNARESEIPGTINIDSTSGSVQINSQFEISLSSFDIPRPRFIFVRLDDVQEVRVTLHLKRTQ